MNSQKTLLILIASLYIIGAAAVHAEEPPATVFAPDRFSHTPSDSHPLTQNFRPIVRMTDQSRPASVLIKYRHSNHTREFQKRLEDPIGSGNWRTVIYVEDLPAVGFSYWFEAVYGDGRAVRSGSYNALLISPPAEIREVFHKDLASGKTVSIVDREIVLKFKMPDWEGKDARFEILRICSLTGGGVLDYDKHRQIVRMRLFGDTDVDSAVRALSSRWALEYAEPVPLYELALKSNDEYFDAQWAVRAIELNRAWNITTGDAGVVIGIIDTGRDPNNPDLISKYLDGWDFVKSDLHPEDEDGHGTAMAGIAAAAGNNVFGIAGVDWSARVLPFRAGRKLIGNWAAVQALNEMKARHTPIVLMAFASPFRSKLMEEAVLESARSNVAIVSPAGNSGATVPNYPAAFSDVIAVSATDAMDRRCSFSSFGPWIDCAAPGHRIMTLVPGGFRYADGTSAAAALVAGTLALMKSVQPALSRHQLIDILTRTAEDLGSPGFDAEYGHGRISAGRAVSDVLRQKNSDYIPPSISHSPVSSANSGQALYVQATVRDNTFVYSAVLRYRKKGDPVFSNLPMENSAAAHFSATIPSEMFSYRDVEYQITAIDPFGNESRTSIYTILLPRMETPDTVTITGFNTEIPNRIEAGDAGSAADNIVAVLTALPDHLPVDSSSLNQASSGTASETSHINDTPPPPGLAVEALAGSTDDTDALNISLSLPALPKANPPVASEILTNGQFNVSTGWEQITASSSTCLLEWKNSVRPPADVQTRPAGADGSGTTSAATTATLELTLETDVVSPGEGVMARGTIRMADGTALNDNRPVYVENRKTSLRWETIYRAIDGEFRHGFPAPSAPGVYPIEAWIHSHPYYARDVKFLYVLGGDEPGGGKKKPAGETCSPPLPDCCGKCKKKKITPAVASRRWKGTIGNPGRGRQVTVFDPATPENKPVVQRPINPAGDFDLGELPPDLKSLRIRVEAPNSIPAFSDVALPAADGMDGIIQLGDEPAPVNPEREVVVHAPDPAQPAEASAGTGGEGGTGVQIDVPATALPVEYFLIVQDPEDMEEIEKAAAARGFRLLAAKRYRIISGRTGEELTQRVSKKIRVALPAGKLLKGEKAFLAGYRPASRKFQITPTSQLINASTHISDEMDYSPVFVSLAAAEGAGAATFSDFENLLVYPNPSKPLYGLNRMIFEYLPRLSTLTIYTPSGEKICEIDNEGTGDINGSTRAAPEDIHIGWDLKNGDGRPVASGMYLFVLQDREKHVASGRIGVIR